MTVAIIGVGLIGGSMALALRDLGIADRVVGVDANEDHQRRALELGLIDEAAGLDAAIQQSSLIILAIPVDAAALLLPGIMDSVDKQVVMDVSSTKKQIIQAVRDHPKRGRFVASHPMWGTEYSGPEAAVKGAFTGKAAVIINKEESDADALAMVENIYRKIGMSLLYMEAGAHDLHAAYVSHISHITSFALANTVLKKEKEEDAIFALASAGFESTVRLAKSNPAMWAPIFIQNQQNVLEVLNEHIAQLNAFKRCLENKDYAGMVELMENANKIRKILK
ncbi:MAG: prephenate dehydrogenase [Chitinophagaceae bacterium]|nr:prephenate dehydrogenase [Chitinophagaceae bacterium]